MRTLQMGSTGPAVQLLQLALNRGGYGELEKDGDFGAATRAALISFQRRNNLAPDGIAGPLTQRALLPWYMGYMVHHIRSGDTVFKLAGDYGADMDAILTANPKIDAHNLHIGAELIIPLPFKVVPTDIAWCSALTGYCVRGLAARYPFISAGEIGKSAMGRPLWRLGIGSGENRVMYNGAHHANEWITTPLLLKFAEELAAAYAKKDEIYNVSARELLSYAAIHIVPAVNPDGIDLVTGELQSGNEFDRARNIAADYPQFDFPAGWKANIRGTDLNLQYPAGWEQAKRNKYAQGIVSPAPADFVGSHPLAAPESAAMYAATLSLQPNLILAYHTQGEVIYWQYSDLEPAGSREIAETLSSVSGYAVEETPYASAFAGYKDWFIQDFDRPGYTIEAGLGTNPLPIKDFDGIYRRNLGILTLAAVLT